MKWLFLLGLLAVSSVWASPNAAKENEGEKVALNERSKRDVADGEGNAERIRHIRKKRDAGESGESSELDLDVDINVGGSRGKSDIDIKVNVGSVDGEKTNASQKEQGETEPCACVESLRVLGESLGNQLNTLIQTLVALKERGEANIGTAGTRAPSSAVAAVKSLRSGVSLSVIKQLFTFWQVYCNYVNFQFFGMVQRCWYERRRHRRDATPEMTTTPFPEPKQSPSAETGGPLCIADDLVTILTGIAGETSLALTITEQAATDTSITADLLSDIDGVIGSLENHKEMAENMKKEIEELPC